MAGEGMESQVGEGGGEGKLILWLNAQSAFEWPFVCAKFHFLKNEITITKK